MKKGPDKDLMKLNILNNFAATQLSQEKVTKTDKWNQQHMEMIVKTKLMGKYVMFVYLFDMCLCMCVCVCVSVCVFVEGGDFFVWFIEFQA